MFFRGQSIEITSSSAKKRKHPNIGDRGFISAGAIVMHMNHYFALIEAYFYQYEYDDSPCRCERKLFLMCNPNDAEALCIAKAGIIVPNLTCVYALTYDEILRYIYYNTIEVPYGIAFYMDGAFNIATAKNKGKLIKPAICTVNKVSPISVEKCKYTRAAWFRAADKYLYNLETVRANMENRAKLSKFYLDNAAMHIQKYEYTKSKEYLSPFRVYAEPTSRLRISKLMESANKAQSFILSFIDNSKDPSFIGFRSLLDFHRSIGSSCAALNRFYELF